MSFFSDFLESTDISDAKNEVSCEIVFGKYLHIVGKLKIDNMTSCEIILRNKRDLIKIIGKDLIVSSVAKGEIEVQGQVDGVFREWMVQ